MEKMRKNLEKIGILEKRIFENGKMENFGILEKLIFEKWKNGKFWSVWYKMVPKWYQNGTIWYHYGTIWYHMVPYGTSGRRNPVQSVKRANGSRVTHKLHACPRKILKK